LTVTRSHSLPTGWAAQAALLAALLALVGCGPKGGPSDNDRRMQAIQNATDDLKCKGVKIEDRNYPQGRAVAVNLNGFEVNEQVLRQVKGLGNVSELNLSKTGFGDDHVGLVNELGLFTLALKLDLSNTALTDVGFQKLENLRFLSQMNLKGTKVSRAAVENFKKKRENDTGILPLFRKPSIQVD
jgi:hypothetical protein